MRYRSLKAACALLVAAGMAMPAAVLAAQYRGSASGTVTVSEAVNDDIYAGGTVVTLAAPSTGDAVMAGGTVLLNAPVGESVLAAGGTVTVMGGVTDDVRVIGGNIFLNGGIGHDAMAVGGQITVSPSASVGRDLVILGGTVTIEGPVDGNLYVRGSDVTVNAPIKGSADISGRTVSFGSKASIGGKLTYSAPEQVNVPSGLAGGGVDFRVMRMRADNGGRNAVAALFTVAFLVKMLSLLVLALVLAAVFRKRVSALTQEAMGHFGWDLLKGFGALVLVPIGAFVLLVTVIGIPFAAMAAAAYVILVTLAGIMAPILVGSLIWRLASRSGAYPVTALSIIVGVVASALIGLVPVIGWIFGFVFMLAALGTLCRATCAAIRSAQEGSRK